VVVAAVLDMSLYLIPVVLGVRVVVVRDNRRQLELLELQIQAVAVAVADITLLAQLIMLAATAAQASSSFPMLAHNNLVAVSSQLMAQTPFTHLQLLALLFQSHL
jgi:NAD(P)-dependent dehydrogenase (short-subunit alcohol dehydrogenase family)